MWRAPGTLLPVAPNPGSLMHTCTCQRGRTAWRRSFFCPGHRHACTGSSAQLGPEVMARHARTHTSGSASPSVQPCTCAAAPGRVFDASDRADGRSGAVRGRCVPLWPAPPCLPDAEGAARGLCCRAVEGRAGARVVPAFCLRAAARAVLVARGPSSAEQLASDATRWRGRR